MAEEPEADKDGLRNRFLGVQLRPRNNRGLTCIGGSQSNELMKTSSVVIEDYTTQVLYQWMMLPGLYDDGYTG